MAERWEYIWDYSRSNGDLKWLVISICIPRIGTMCTEVQQEWKKLGSRRIKAKETKRELNQLFKK